VVLVDARGSGASGGKRVVEYSPAEVADMGEVAAWIARQAWSSGRVGTFGVSYDGNTAELGTSQTPHDGVCASLTLPTTCCPFWPFPACDSLIY